MHGRRWKDFLWKTGEDKRITVKKKELLVASGYLKQKINNIFVLNLYRFIHLVAVLNNNEK